jgi:hypothetical protein
MVGINKVIRTLIISDFLLQAGWGLIGPIFAVFITKSVEGGSLATVGFAAGTFWFTKSIVQLFIGHFLDIKKGEEDDFKFLVGGLFVSNLVPLGYFFSSNILHIIFLEFIRGLAMAAVVPSWAAIFTRHIDKGWEAFSWSIQSTSLGFAVAGAASLGGILATILGFKIVFILVSFFGIISTLVLLRIKKQIFTKEYFGSKESDQ